MTWSGKSVTLGVAMARYDLRNVITLLLDERMFFLRELEVYIQITGLEFWLDTKGMTGVCHQPNRCLWWRMERIYEQGKC